MLDFGSSWGVVDLPQQLGLGAAALVGVAGGFAVGDLDDDAKDDLVVGFGGAGLWRYSNDAWSELHASGPGGLATGRLH